GRRFFSDLLVVGQISRTGGPRDAWFPVIRRKCQPDAREPGEHRTPQQQQRSRKARGLEWNGGFLCNSDVDYSPDVEGVGDAGLFPLLSVEQVILFRLL